MQRFGSAAVRDAVWASTTIRAGKGMQHLVAPVLHGCAAFQAPSENRSSLRAMASLSSRGFTSFAITLATAF